MRVVPPVALGGRRRRPLDTSQSADVWGAWMASMMTRGEAGRAKEILQRAINVLPTAQHVNLISKFGQLEFRCAPRRRRRQPSAAFKIWQQHPNMEPNASLDHPLDHLRPHSSAKQANYSLRPQRVGGTCDHLPPHPSARPIPRPHPRRPWPLPPTRSSKLPSSHNPRPPLASPSSPIPRAHTTLNARSMCVVEICAGTRGLCLRAA